MAIYKIHIGKNAELTAERKQHIFERHPDIAPYFARVKEVLMRPDEIRVDKQDPSVLLFYKYFSKLDSGKYLAVVVKVNTRCFILTVYSTYRVRTGKKYETKNQT